ncbi:MAG: MaoC/PaaZ C-terminal domain-containing protein [Myxococcota bacterium]
MPFDMKMVGQVIGPTEFTYDWQRVALYALGCGATEEELDLLLETRGPKVLPTFAVVPSFVPLHASLVRLGGNMLTLVHGAQKVEMRKPIPPEGRLLSTAQVTALWDKGKGALAIIRTETKTANGDHLFDTEWQIFYRGEGGFGGERGPDGPSYAPPEGKAADHTLDMKTAPAQALLYRLGSSDLNPIHSEPEIAKKVGFPAPILHGLCTFGHAGRAAVKAIAGGDPSRIASIEGRFTKVVFPGDTISTALWNMGPGEAYFTSTIKERSEAAITLGRVTLTG